ncbi:Transthyretin-like family protein [Cooperia oncophora]
MYLECPVTDSVFPGVLDTDDLMASGKTDSNGEYNLSGSTKEFTGIEPYIAIYHDCNDGIKVSIAYMVTLSRINSKKRCT